MHSGCGNILTQSLLWQIEGSGLFWYNSYTLYFTHTLYNALMCPHNSTCALLTNVCSRDRENITHENHIQKVLTPGLSLITKVIRTCCQQGLDLSWLQRCVIWNNFPNVQVTIPNNVLVWLLVHLENYFISHTWIKKRIHSLQRISWTDVSVQFCPWSHDWRSEEWMENKLHVSFTS